MFMIRPFTCDFCILRKLSVPIRSFNESFMRCCPVVLTAVRGLVPNVISITLCDTFALKIAVIVIFSGYLKVVVNAVQFSLCKE